MKERPRVFRKREKFKVFRPKNEIELVEAIREIGERKPNWLKNWRKTKRWVKE